MTIEEAIYCMKSYLPDTNSYTECKKCKYYKSKMDARGCYLCQSSEAHKMAIRSLEAWEKVLKELEEIENDPYGDDETWDFEMGVGVAITAIKEHLKEVENVDSD